MIKVTPIASGSSGNCTHVTVNGYSFLLDCGIPGKHIPKGVQAIFVSHSHGDHLPKNPVAPLHRPSESPDQWDKPDYSTDTFTALPHGGYVLAVTMDHDVPCCAFLVSDGLRRFGYITDTGTIPCDSIPYFVGLDLLHLEFNHDTDMLIGGAYQDDLKARVAETHLNNTQAIDFCKLVEPKRIIAGHLSSKNNSPGLVVGLCELHNITCETAPCDTITLI